MRICTIGMLAVLFALGACSSDNGGTAGRTQLPIEYSAKDVMVTGSQAGTSLAGTLTWPTEGCPCPTAILVPGVGSHDRDYTVFGHKPFMLLADHLGRNGIATLRFDERGIGGSGGDPRGATTGDRRWCMARI